jgi:hypothetical protein
LMRCGACVARDGAGVLREHRQRRPGRHVACAAEGAQVGEEARRAVEAGGAYFFLVAAFFLGAAFFLVAAFFLGAAFFLVAAAFFLGAAFFLVAAAFFLGAAFFFLVAAFFCGVGADRA